MSSIHFHLLDIKLFVIAFDELIRRVTINRKRLHGLTPKFPLTYRI